MLRKIVKEFKERYEPITPLDEMTNIEKSVTGLSVNIYISTKNAKHGPRIKLSKQGINFICSVTIEDNPRLIGQCRIKRKDLNKIFKWIKINKQILLDLWNGKIGHYQAITNLDMSVFKEDE